MSMRKYYQYMANVSKKNESDEMELPSEGAKETLANEKDCNKEILAALHKIEENTWHIKDLVQLFTFIMVINIIALIAGIIIMLPR